MVVEVVDGRCSNDALSGKILSAPQIQFVEMIVEHLTASGRMEPELLYASPFTETTPNGVSDVFASPEVLKITETLAIFEPRLERTG